MNLLSALRSEKKLVDVTGIEPVTPCLQSRRGKKLKALSGVAYTETWRNSRSLKCPEVVPNFSAPLSFMLAPQSAIFAIVRSGRSNLCPSHYSLNSLSEFDGTKLLARWALCVRYSAT
jgi:hypothetical protein